MKRASHELPPEIALPPSAATELSARWGVHDVRWPARTVLTILVVWTAMGLFEAVPDMLDGFKWNETIGKLIEAWSWALLTPAILLLDREITLANPSVPRLAGAHLVLSVPFAVIHTYLAGLLMYPVPTIWWNPLRSTEFAIYFYLGGWVTYCAFIAALQAFKFHNSLLTSQIALERVEKRLAESQLNALRLQLEPHFLFNTLNAISSEVTTDPELAREMIENLGALLRQSLDCQDSTEITLAQELALLDHYISIQKLRFGDRISIRVEAEPAALSANVPSMLLQPLVENAVRHGVEKRLSGGTIVVSARRSRGQLHIKVLDDGVGLPRQWRMESCAGLGVRVTRERLQALHGESDEHVFSISRRKGGGTQVAISIPLHGTGGEA
ncbi:MAG TPA: histidine kinase, partial [Sphingomonas sp.]|nr:histidine kinase [Sphingomonas sp.]